MELATYVVKKGIWQRIVGITKIMVTRKPTEEESPSGADLEGSAITVVR